MTKTRRTLLIAMTAGLVVRLAIIPFLYTEWTDPFVVEHWAFGRVARSLVQGHGFGNAFADTGSTAILPPVYAYILAGIFRLFGPNTIASVVAAAALNSVLSVLTCIPIFLIARRCFGDRAAKWAAWGWALSPYGIYFSADWLWSTCVFTLLLTTLFLYSLRLETSDSLPRWTGFGLFAGFTVLTEPVALSVIPVLAGVSGFHLRRQGKRWIAPGLAAALACIAVLTPWIVRNYDVFHRFIPVRDGYGLELYLGNSGYTGHWANRAVHPNHSASELAEYERSGEIAYMAHKRDQAVAFIETHPGWFLWMSLRRAIYMWSGFWSFDPAYLAQEPLDPPNVFMATSLTVLALLGLWSAFRHKNAHAVRFGATIACFPAVYYVSHPEAYYFRPIDPLIVILAVYALASLIRPGQTITS
jgi:4-amino-4-deoxy-L-arabinose transferase-like glycosyltransferase